MIHIKIISHNNSWIRRQLPSSNNIFNECNFIFDDNQLDCDYCFILDGVQSPININCPKNNIILCICEPKSVKIYPASYYQQFGRVASFYNFKGLDNIDIDIPLLPWMVGLKFNLKKKSWDNENILNFSDLNTHTNHSKLNKIAIISSNKAFTLGHKRRLSFVKFLKKHLPEQIDIYGNGFSPIVDKLEVLSKYKYSIVIENSQFKNYWTEKLADAYLSECYPIYIGCPNIYDYFNHSELSTLKLSENPSTIKKIIQIIDNNSYSQHIDDIITAKNKILYQYNLITQISDFVARDYKTKLCQNLTTIQPINRNFIEKIKAYFSLKYYQTK